MKSDRIQAALARIAGQVGGIKRMYSGRENCLQIVQQVAAARAALGSVGRELLKQEACQCMLKQSEKNKFDKILKQLFK